MLEVEDSLVSGHIARTGLSELRGTPVQAPVMCNRGASKVATNSVISA